jgi:branched-chain amino acid aminotransferase
VEWDLPKLPEIMQLLCILRNSTQTGYDQLLWTDGKEHQYFEESGTMNVMFIINDVLITPPTTDSILKGITRDSVLQLARDWGMKIEERPVSVKEVMQAIASGTLRKLLA